MAFNPNQPPQKENHSSIIEKMVLESKYLEKLPSPEKMLSDIEQTVRSGKSEAAELIREYRLTEKITQAKGKVSFLHKENVLTYLKAIHFQNDPNYSEYGELEKIGGMYDPVTKKIDALIDPSELTEKNNLTKARLLTNVTHELLHSVAKNLKITWLNEGITERLTQGLIGDITISSQEWNEIFQNLTEDEDEKVRFKSYAGERSQINVLSENILDTCLSYAELPKGNFRERNKSESIVFKENFGNAYFVGDFSTLEKNIKELGYSSISELQALYPKL